MAHLLLVVAIFTLVFGLDYLWYARNPSQYQYVSRRTYLLFLSAIFPVVSIFYADFKPFSDKIWTEVIFILILLFMMVLFSFVLTREKLLVCHISSRTERCLTPGYVFTKGKEILFQQFCYAGVAFSLVQLLGVHIWTYIAYVMILLIMHTPVVISMNKPAAQRLTFGIVIISAPIFYVFTEIGYLWPAVYLQTLLYVFIWLTYANWEGKGKLVSYETPKGG